MIKNLYQKNNNNLKILILFLFSNKFMTIKKPIDFYFFSNNNINIFNKNSIIKNIKPFSVYLFLSVLFPFLIYILYVKIFPKNIMSSTHILPLQGNIPSSESITDIPEEIKPIILQQNIRSDEPIQLLPSQEFINSIKIIKSIREDPDCINFFKTKFSIELKDILDQKDEKKLTTDILEEMKNEVHVSSLSKFLEKKSFIDIFTMRNFINQLKLIYSTNGDFKNLLQKNNLNFQDINFHVIQRDCNLLRENILNETNSILMKKYSSKTHEQIKKNYQYFVNQTSPEEILNNQKKQFALNQLFNFNFVLNTSYGTERIMGCQINSAVGLYAVEDISYVSLNKKDNFGQYIMIFSLNHETGTIKFHHLNNKFGSSKNETPSISLSLSRNIGEIFRNNKLTNWDEAVSKIRLNQEESLDKIPKDILLLVKEIQHCTMAITANAFTKK